MELVSEVGVALIQNNASDDMVAMAAWVSHDADSEERLKNREQVKKLINFLYTNKHMSPFEHGQFTFKIDVPIFVAREFHRHRTFSYNEVSGRYTEMKPRFWVGDVARVQEGKPGAYTFHDGDSEQTAIYLQSKRKATKKAWREYTRRLEAGQAKEQAREDLPLSLMTQFYATVNPRNLMAFLTLRNDKSALKEIRMVAEKMEQIFAEQMPLTYRAFAEQREREQTPSVNMDADLLLEVSELRQINAKYEHNDKLKSEKIADLENQLRLARAEVEALGEVLLEVQSEKSEVWKQATDPVQEFKVVINDVMGNPEKVAKTVMDLIAREMKRKGRGL